jgi:hypothetical protein
MRSEWRYIGSFTAVDKQGKAYAVEAERLYHIVGDDETEGVGRLKTSSGDSVRKVGDRRYEIVTFSGNIPITSDDPNAL